MTIYIVGGKIYDDTGTASVIVGDSIFQGQGGGTAGGSTTDQSVSGSMTPSGAFSSKSILSNILAGSISASGLLLKTALKYPVGSSTASGGLLKTAQKQLIGSSTSSGTLATQIVSLQNVDGSVTPSGILSFLILIVLAGVMTVAGAIQKQCSKILTGSTALSGNLTKRIDKILSGELSLIGTLYEVAVVIVVLTGAVTISGIASAIVTTPPLVTKAIKGVALKGIALIGKALRGNDI